MVAVAEVKSILKSAGDQHVMEVNKYKEKSKVEVHAEDDHH